MKPTFSYSSSWNPRVRWTFEIKSGQNVITTERKKMEKVDVFQSFFFF